ncbi:hypothetical protein [Halomarina oriensis]|uniref:Uncharacterized protein n=1 Tax=Halomarina oriensis TaxID=671145 RepID=A0A6B0GRY0_9EURY|nr:hypothetical protein [Halomarina oriensis]MWG35453.1 hypothetical protein [Halomarina oriensis]
MSDGKLGLSGATAIGLGGMIGGGVFSVLGVVAAIAGAAAWAAFTAYGSLSGITSFGSLAFIVVFGVMSFIAFQRRDEDAIRGAIPTLGVLGTTAAFPLLLYHLYTAERGTFYAVALVSVAVVAVELLYFERDELADLVAEAERQV